MAFQYGGNYGRSGYGNGRPVSGIEALQGIQSFIGDVADVGPERKSVLVGNLYPLTGTADEFDIKEQELVFSTGITSEHDPVSGIQTTYYSPGRSMEGVWSCFNGLREGDMPILRGISMSDFQAGPAARSKTNQSTTTVAYHGHVEPPCGDPLIRPGQLVCWDVSPPQIDSKYLIGSEDAYAASALNIGTEQSGRVLAFVKGYNPAGDSTDAYPVRIYNAMCGKPTAFKKFDEVSRRIIDTMRAYIKAGGGVAADRRGMIAAIAEASARTEDVTNKRAVDLSKQFDASVAAGTITADALVMLGVLELVKHAHQVDHMMQSRICGRAVQAPSDSGRVAISMQL